MNEKIEEVRLQTPFITLGAFLKWISVVPTGGQAKELIRRGQIKVNGEIVLERGRKLRAGDEVEVPGWGIYRLRGTKEQENSDH